MKQKFMCFVLITASSAAFADTMEDNIRASAFPAPDQASANCPATVSERTHDTVGVPVGEAIVALYKTAKIAAGTQPPIVPSCSSKP